MWTCHRLSNPRRCASNISQRPVQRPCPGYIVFHVLENGLPTLPSLRRAGGPWASSKHPPTASPGTGRHRKPSKDSSYVAPPPVQAVECLQASQAQNPKNASAVFAVRSVRCVTTGTRDPSSPAVAEWRAPSKLYGSTEVWNSLNRVNTH